MRRVFLVSVILVGWLMCCGIAVAAHGSPVAWWQFDQQNGSIATDTAGGKSDAILGEFDYVDGVKGKCLKFDGQTTRVYRKASEVPALTDAFTIEAWIAPQTYSWNWTGIVSQAGNVVGDKGEKKISFEDGLVGTKFGESNFSGPEGVNILEKIDQDWSGGAKDWAGRWRGYIVGPVTGEVTFSAVANNTIKVEIDNQVIVEGQGDAISGKMNMEKGVKYPIVLSYQQSGGDSILKLTWNWTGQPGRAIEGDDLTHSSEDVEYVESKELKREGPAPVRNHRIFFGIDSSGHIGADVMVNGELVKCVSEEKVDLLKWVHVAATFDKDSGINIYIDGEKAGSTAAKGLITPAVGHDMFVGKNQLKMSPTNSERKASAAIMSHMIFDGLIDEVKIYNTAFSPEQIKASFASLKPAVKQPLKFRVMPSGPDVPAKFGAYQTTLKYAPEWDRYWRIGPDADIVVRFDDSPIKMVFWHGTAYGAAWVAENGKWMGDQSVERSGGGKSKMGCAEHMADKQCRYGHVRLLENNDARVVIHWRYAISDIIYDIFAADKDGWGEWADEYYYIYPDGVSTRYQILFSNYLSHEYQETIVLNQPGTKPEDNIELDALTMATMDGDTQTFTWRTKPRRRDNKLDNPNIQVVNLKTKNKPFIIWEPAPGIKVMECCIEEERTHFAWWNHWPVGQIPNDGRRAPREDRPSHTSLSQSIEETDVIKHDKEKGTYSAVTIMGMTPDPIEGLIPLARSWNFPPELQITSSGYSSEGYDRPQRAYIINKDNNEASALKFKLAATGNSPLVNPAFVVKGWPEGRVSVKIDGENIWGYHPRIGFNHTIDRSDMIIYIEMDRTEPVEVTITPVK